MIWPIVDLLTCRAQNSSHVPIYLHICSQHVELDNKYVWLESKIRNSQLLENHTLIIFYCFDMYIASHQPNKHFTNSSLGCLTWTIPKWKTPYVSLLSQPFCSVMFNFSLIFVLAICLSINYVVSHYMHVRRINGNTCENVPYSCTLFCTNTTLIIANTQKVKNTKLFWHVVICTKSSQNTFYKVLKDCIQQKYIV